VVEVDVVDVEVEVEVVDVEVLVDGAKQQTSY
jgi:hypothetical protein